MRAKHTWLRRRGVASMLAMLYMIIFAVLSVGFYASTTIFTQISYNERRGVDAQLAAETGADFMRYALYQVVIPSSTPEANLLQEVHNDLRDLLEGTGNLAGNGINLTNSNTIIEIPAGTGNYIQAGGGRKFRADITAPSPNPNRSLIVTVRAVGTRTNDRSAIRVTFDREEAPTELFGYGMVSQGQVQILTKNIVQGLPAEQARIMTRSTVNPPITVGTASGTSYGGVAGDLYVLQGVPAPVVYPNWSVGGTTDPVAITSNHIHYIPGADLPPMPVPVTSIYRDFATNNYVAGLAYYKNIVIPPNTNPQFNGPTQIEGVVYIKQPNKVTFAGNCTIKGVIVGENANVGTLLTNAVIFTGMGGAKAGVEALPDTPEFTGLKKLAGSFIVAPGFDVQLTGNFGSINGHIAGDKVTLSGATNSNVTGSIVALKSTLTIGGNTAATLVYDSMQGHAGLRVEDRFVPVMSTWEELR